MVTIDKGVLTATAEHEGKTFSLVVDVAGATLSDPDGAEIILPKAVFVELWQGFRSLSAVAGLLDVQ